MSNEAVLPVGGLSEVERVVDVFVAPSKTFTDILRKATWWLPFVLIGIFSLATSLVVSKKVGFAQVQATQIHASPKQEQALADASPEQRAMQMKVGLAITKGISYGIPVVILIGSLLYALILWACFNFVLGAQTTFWQVMATVMYASLPYVILSVLTMLTLSFGGSPEAYDFKMPAGTNPAFYMPDASPILKALLQRLDLIQLWILGLTVYGMAIVAKKSVTQSAMVVGGLWLIMTLVTVAGAAFSS